MLPNKNSEQDFFAVLPPITNDDDEDLEKDLTKPTIEAPILFAQNNTTTKCKYLILNTYKLQKRGNVVLSEQFTFSRHKAKLYA
ncbi:unnamed protein product [Dovyalis caffra]|uniref:Uncharacterized protein n=1 Tax=Dovyalis caffra TaxID=77055 RepID=A0AAV1S3F1_9ROSI|nr:unnamed protein product [Dovyalis caffra]